jgi:hypothetical protein
MRGAESALEVSMRSIAFPLIVFLLTLARVSAAPEPYFGYSSFGSAAGFHPVLTPFQTPKSRPAHALVKPQPTRAAQPEREDDRAEEQTSNTHDAGPTVPGSQAVLRRGVAYAPASAPEAVKRAIWAANTLRNKPYRFGGGHGSFSDCGYDCSGTVSFALHYAGALGSPLDSHSLMGFGRNGRGRWITVYTRNGHAFAVIAGLRLDTTGSRGNEGPRWHTDTRAPWGFSARHPEGL